MPNAFASIRTLAQPRPPAVPALPPCTCGPGVQCASCKAYGYKPFKPHELAIKHVQQAHATVTVDTATLEAMVAQHTQLVTDIAASTRGTLHRKHLQVRLKRLRAKLARRGVELLPDGTVRYPPPPPPEPDPQHASVASLYAWHLRYALVGSPEQRQGKIWPRRSLILLGQAFLRQHGHLPCDRELSTWHAMPSGKTILREFGGLGAYHWAISHEQVV